MRPNRQPHSVRSRPVTPVAYAPPSGYSLDVELYPAVELRRRAGNVELRGFERIDFHCLLYVTAGRYVHMVDFDMLDCMRGSLILLQPGQVHRFGDLTGWDGWLLVFRSEVLPARSADSRTVGELETMQQVEALPARLVLGAATQAAVSETFERMAEDARRPATRAVNALLRSQLEALLIRLIVENAAPTHGDAIEPTVLRRFRRYRAAVERKFANWHSVAHYAKHLGCSEKSLNRAALAVSDRNAKAVLTDRIVLEAKRLLAHSLLPVAIVGDCLGFSEATNFVKFFRRETGLTPGAFRAQLTGSKQRVASE
jgi:AraC-like DNA-binding protein